jgi:hypothetical protein
MLWGTQASRPLKLLPTHDVFGNVIGAVVVRAVVWTGGAATGLASTASAAWREWRGAAANRSVQMNRTRGDALRTASFSAFII